MYICKETRKPMGITEINSLIIDRNNPYDNFSRPRPIVCLSLEGILFRKIKHSERSMIPDNWLDSAIDITYVKENEIENYTLLQRPGAADLLVELVKHASPMIYSTQSNEFIEEALLQLSIAQGDPETCTEAEYQKSEAYMEHSVWSRNQCIEMATGYKKSLGTLSEFLEEGINDIWLIDHQPNRVDFPSHVIAIPSFTGDPKDCELYRLIDRIFIN